MSYEPENPTSDIGDDAQRWLFAEFERISEEIILLRQENAGRAGLLLSAPVADTALITQTPTKITGYDSIMSPQRFASANLANSTIRIATEGLWFIAIKAIVRIVAHTGNYSRGVVMELYNETKAQTYKVVDYSAIARYEDLVDFTISIPVYMPDSIIGDELAVYVYSTTTNSIQLTQLEILEFELILLSRF
jgi:hypothetical protein